MIVNKLKQLYLSINYTKASIKVDQTVKGITNGNA